MNQTTWPVEHSGPVFVGNGLVLMAHIAKGDKDDPYKLRIWEVNHRDGLEAETDELMKAMWTLTASLLERYNQNILEAMENVKAAIVTLVQEMDLKTKDAQYMMAAISNPSIKLVPPKK